MHIVVCLAFVNEFFSWFFFFFCFWSLSCPFFLFIIRLCVREAYSFKSKHYIWSRLRIEEDCCCFALAIHHALILFKIFHPIWGVTLSVVFWWIFSVADTIFFFVQQILLHLNQNSDNLSVLAWRTTKKKHSHILNSLFTQQRKYFVTPSLYAVWNCNPSKQKQNTTSTTTRAAIAAMTIKV